MPVTQAIMELERYAAMNPRAELLRVTLMAAAAAAQSERSDMALLLEQAVTLEEKMVATSGTSAPGVTAHEVAGDLWLQVHRFDSSRAAYQRASELFGLTPGIALGLARVAVQLHDDVRACDAYRWVVRQWSSTSAPAEILEARAFVGSSRCAASGGR
jgi:hypothetical protein